MLAAKLEIELSKCVEDTDAIRFESVCFSFQRSDNSLNAVLNSFNLCLRYGQIVGIVGRNASGKSTLLNIVRGELIPQAGTVLAGGRVVSQNGRCVRHPSVTLVSQKPDAGLSPTMTVYENFVLASCGRGFSFNFAYTKKLKAACSELLSRANMGLEAKLSEQVRFLSGGQQQALSVLLALNSPERVLLMDEPTASLDVMSSINLLSLTCREARASQTLVVMVSHRLKDLIEYCDRIILLHRGQVNMDIVRGDANWMEEALFRHLVSES